MPIKRQKTYAAAIHSLSELLVALQLDGHLDGARVPSWAIGTSVSEAFDALKMLGDGAWLDGVYEDLGEYESADRWFADFLEGKEVPTPDDVANSQDEDEDASGGSADEALKQYLINLPLKQRTSLQKRLQDSEFRERAVKLLDSAGLVMAGAYCADDNELAGLVKSAQCLDPEYLADSDLAEMARFHIIDSKDDVLNAMHGHFGGDLGRALRRAGALGSQFNKAIAKSSKAAKAPTAAKASKSAKAPTPVKTTKTAKAPTASKPAKATKAPATAKVAKVTKRA